MVQVPHFEQVIVRPEGLYQLRFKGTELFPRKKEDCEKMGFKYGQMLSWKFEVLEGNFKGAEVSGLSPLNWTKKNQTGRWIEIVGGAMPQEGTSPDPDVFAGKVVIGYIEIGTSNKSEREYNNVKDIFPTGGIVPGVAAAPVQAPALQPVAAPAQPAVVESVPTAPVAQVGDAATVTQPQPGKKLTF